MGRKVALTTAAIMVVVLSVVLVGGQVGGGGFLWWGNREPIYIYGNDSFTMDHGVISGTGTADDPYIIEGWRVDSPKADYGIYVDHTTVHFVIRDCVFERARLAGVYFNTVRNGRVEQTQIGLADTAVYLLDSTDNVFSGNVVAENRYGVVMGANSRGNEIVENTFLDNGLSAYDPYRWNVWFESKRGNYWSDYDGEDSDGDGIGDARYDHVDDAYPLVEPPVEWVRVAPAGLSFAGNQVTPDGALLVTSQTPITLSAMDPGSGVAEIHYAIDGEEWLSYGGPIYISGEDGPRTLTYYGIDYLGNVEPKQTVSLFLDNHPPETVIEVGEPSHVDSRGTWVTSSSLLTLRLAESSTYGQTTIYYAIDGRGWRQYSRPFVIMGSDGPYRISYYAQNASGVAEAPKSIVLYKDDAAPNTRGGKASPSVGVEIGESISKPEPPPPPEVPPVIPEPQSEPEPQPEPEAQPAPQPEPEPQEAAPVVAEPVEEAPATDATTGEGSAAGQPEPTPAEPRVKPESEGEPAAGNETPVDEPATGSGNQAETETDTGTGPNT